MDTNIMLVCLKVMIYKFFVENSERDGNTRPPDLPLEHLVHDIIRSQTLVSSLLHQASSF